MTSPYISLADFCKTLPEQAGAFFMDKWSRIVQESPKTYSLLNTPDGWQKLFTRVDRCDMLCTYGCNETTRTDELGCTRRCGCMQMAGDAR